MRALLRTSLLGSCLTLAGAQLAAAQTYGPGPIGPVTVSSGSATVVGSTAVTGAGQGVLADGSGTATLGADVTVATTGSVAFGLGVEGGGRIDASAPLVVTLQGAGSTRNGIYVHDGGRLTLAAGSRIDVAGGVAVGVTVDNSDLASAPIGALTINLGGSDQNTGVVAVNGGKAAFDGLTIQGAAAAGGVLARDLGSSVSLVGASRITVVRDSPNYYVLTAGRTLASLGNPYASYATAPSFGVSAQDGARLVGEGAVIAVSSSTGVGAYALRGARIDLTGGSVALTGGRYGIQAASAATVTGHDLRVTADGGLSALRTDAGNNAATPESPSLIDLTGGAVVATGRTYGFTSLNYYGAAPNELRLTGVRLTSETLAFGAQGRADVTIGGGAVVEAPLLATAWDQTFGPQPTRLRIAASGASQLSGDAEAEPASRLELTLSDRARWTGAAFAVTMVDIQATAAWTVTESSNLTEQLANAGLVEFLAPVGSVTQPANYKTLSTRDYVGAGGELGFNTYLGDDDSPTDRLVIDGGAASGETFVRVHATGGEGALTTGDGILLVQTADGGVTEPGAFRLASFVIGGPYEYLLFRGGRAAGAENDWFLRSAVCPAPGGTAPCPTPDPPPPPPDPPTPPPTPPPPDPEPPPPIPPTPPNPPVPPDPGPQPAPPEPGPEPIVRQEVSLYTALPAMAALYGRMSIDTLHERVGEEEQLRGRFAPDDDDDVNGAWVRVVGLAGRRDGGSRGVLDEEGPRFRYELYALQAGLDLYRKEDEDGVRRHAGVYGAIGRVEGKVEHYDGSNAGRNRIDAYTLGGYWTRFGAKGGYVDLVAQYTWYDGKAESTRLPVTEGDASALALSAEAGKPFDLKDGWRLEPQGQLVYQRFYGGDADDIAAKVTFEDTTAVLGRLGARLLRDWDAEDEHGETRARTGWARLNLWHAFDYAPRTVFSSGDGPVAFEADVGGTWLELNGGFTGQLTQTATVYVNAGYQWDLDGKGYSYSGKLGMRFNW